MKQFRLCFVFCLLITAAKSPFSTGVVDLKQVPPPLRSCHRVLVSSVWNVKLTQLESHHLPPLQGRLRLEAWLFRMLPHPVGILTGRKTSKRAKRHSPQHSAHLTKTNWGILTPSVPHQHPACLASPALCFAPEQDQADVQEENLKPVFPSCKQEGISPFTKFVEGSLSLPLGKKRKSWTLFFQKAAIRKTLALSLFPYNLHKRPWGWDRRLGQPVKVEDQIGCPKVGDKGEARNGDGKGRGHSSHWLNLKSAFSTRALVAKSNTIGGEEKLPANTLHTCNTRMSTRLCLCLYMWLELGWVPEGAHV